MREQHGRSGPWLQLARLQSQLNTANTTNERLQNRVSEATQKVAAEKHTARVTVVSLQAKIRADKRTFECTQNEQHAKHRRVQQRSIGANRKLIEQNVALKAKQKQLNVQLLESTNLQSHHIRERVSRAVGTATAKLHKQLSNSRARVHKLNETQAEMTDAMRGWKAARASLAHEHRQTAKEAQSKIRRSFAEKISNKTAALRVTMQQKLNEERAKRDALQAEHGHKLLECRAALEAATASLRAEKDSIANQVTALKAQYQAQSAELKRERAELKLTKSKVRTKLHLSHRAKETFAELVAQKHMLGAGRGYMKQGTSCEQTRMPIHGRTRTDRNTVTTEREKVNKRISRRVKQFENDACEALGIERWPPTDARVLGSLGIGQAEQSKRLHQQLQDVNAKVAQLTADNETKVSRMSQQHADELTVVAQDHASALARLERQSKADIFELEQQQAAQLTVLKVSMSDSTSSKLKIVGHASKRDYERMADVLQAKNVPCKKYWKQLKEEREMRFGFPVTRMLLNSSQCRKFGCKCSRHLRIMGNISATQRFSPAHATCLAMHVVAPFLNVAVTGRSLFTTCRGCWGQPPGGWSAPSGTPIRGRPPFIRRI
jgi:hypothetical protein